MSHTSPALSPQSRTVASIARELNKAALARVALARLLAAGILTIKPTKANAERIFGVKLRGEVKRRLRAGGLARAWAVASETERSELLAEHTAQIWRVFATLSTPPADDPQPETIQ